MKIKDLVLLVKKIRVDDRKQREAYKQGSIECQQYKWFKPTWHSLLTLYLLKMQLAGPNFNGVSFHLGVPHENICCNAGEI